MKAAIALLAIALAIPAAAQEFTAGGYADFRLAADSARKSALDGGFGKLRYSGEGTDGHLAEAALYGRAQLSEDVSAYAEIRHDPDQRTSIDLMEAYLRYRPVSLSPWRWSVKAGAFYPPISLENTGPGWTSPWTLTPSAINSWIGEELRILGGEARLEWRGAEDRIEAQMALYGWNDPVGVVLAQRGWVLTDHMTGLFGRLRLPDAVGSSRQPAPVWREPFSEIGYRPGYYAGLSWRREALGEMRLLRYDNGADPAAAGPKQFAWRTAFWSAGAETDFGDLTALAQAMTGRTSVEPFPGSLFEWDFQSAYLLLGYRLADDWQIALRGEGFATGIDSDSATRSAEHGEAGTLAVNWLARSWLRLTLEGSLVSSWRLQRLAAHEAPAQIDRQLQLGARFSF